MLIPYRVVIPASYREDIPNKLVVYLHGAGGDENRDIERSLNYDGEGGTLWDYLCDKYGYIGLSVNGYADANYGAPSTESPFSEQYAYVAELSEIETLHAIQNVRDKYNIDESRIFLMGNSMGGYGALWLAGKYEGMFRGLSVSGFLPEEDLLDYTALCSIPIRLVMGTEDVYFNSALRLSKTCEEKGLFIETEFITGGTHKTAWSQGEVLENTFRFFDRIVEQTDIPK